MREFSEHVFRHVGFLRGYADDVDTVLQDWKAYKLAVPTYGAIIMDDDCSNVSGSCVVQFCGGQVDRMVQRLRLNIFKKMRK